MVKVSMRTEGHKQISSDLTHASEWFMIEATSMMLSTGSVAMCSKKIFQKPSIAKIGKRTMQIVVG